MPARILKLPNKQKMNILHSNYGNLRVHLVRVARQPERHDVRELNVDVRLEGDFEPSYVDGDNSRTLPPDTIRNTVYAMAGEDTTEAVESLCVRLATHFLEKTPDVTTARIHIAERQWGHMPVAGRESRFS